MPKFTFPHILTDLPQADIPLAGLTAYLLQGVAHQVVLMSFDKDTSVPEHSHEAQWGVVLEGEIELTIDGATMIYRKGSTYFIPKGTPHSAKIRAGYRDLTIFNQKDRYRVRTLT